MHIHHNDILNNVIVVSIDAKTWGGRKKLRAKDITSKASDLPPTDLVSLGSRKVFDPEALKPFLSFKREMEEALAAFGIKFAKNFVVPREEFASARQTLDDIAARHKKHVADFVACYPAGLQSWRDKHPDHTSLLDDAPSVDQIESKFYLGYTPFSIGPAAVDGSEDDSSQAQQLVSGLAGRLYVDVAKTARALVKRMTGRSDITARFLNPLRAIESKLASLSFIDPGVTPMVEEIRRVMSSLPNEKKLGGNDVLAVRGLLSLLSEPSGLRTHAAALGSQACLLLESDEDEDDALLSAILPQAQQPSSAAPASSAQPVSAPVPAAPVAVPIEADDVFSVAI